MPVTTLYLKPLQMPLHFSSAPASFLWVVSLYGEEVFAT